MPLTPFVSPDFTQEVACVKERLVVHAGDGRADWLRQYRSPGQFYPDFTQGFSAWWAVDYSIT